MDLRNTAPLYFSDIWFASTHGAYNLEETPKPFTVPENTIIFETGTIGELCFTNIDNYLMTLSFGLNRIVLLSYLRGDRSLRDPNAPHYRSAIRALHMYIAGDSIYNRTLALTAGRKNSGKSHRIEARSQHWGFFQFPKDDTEPKLSKSGQSPAILALEREMIETGKTITYKDFIEAVYAANPELQRAGCIFIFSNCAEVHSGTPAQVGQVAEHQRAQDLKWLMPAKSGYTENVPGNYSDNVGFTAAQDNLHMNMPIWAEAPQQPLGTKTVWIQDGSSFKQIYTPVDPPSPYWTNLNIRHYKRLNPAQELFTLEHGQIKKLTGGRRRKLQTRRARKYTKRL
jgi:hypothetical protein